MTTKMHMLADALAETRSEVRKRQKRAEAVDCLDAGVPWSIQRTKLSAAGMEPQVEMT
jgi:hypothetical protein